jgi:hypothetical protein
MNKWEKETIFNSYKKIQIHLKLSQSNDYFFEYRN